MRLAELMTVMEAQGVYVAIRSDGRIAIRGPQSRVAAWGAILASRKRELKCALRAVDASRSAVLVLIAANILNQQP
jgi:hypothetical protein